MDENGFLPGERNPQYKGTYVYNLETKTETGPFLKVDVLRMYHISSRKYYEHLNAGTKVSCLAINNSN